MKHKKIRGNHIKKLGITDSKTISWSIEILKKHYKHERFEKRLDLLKMVLDAPSKYEEDPHFGELAKYLQPKEKRKQHTEEANLEAKAFQIFGETEIAENAKHQMHMAMRLPVAIEGALMPDAHHGYGLPIGGVLATQNAVIPYGVGVDIGCRMCLSIFPESSSILEHRKLEFKTMLKEHTKFGQKEVHEKPNDAKVLEDPLFKEIDLLKRLQGKAYSQLGSSGGGNHFVEFGRVHISTLDADLGLPPGNYLGLLSHSGSRGLGATIAQHYTRLAKEQRKLPQGFQHLAWLDLDSEEGMEYWLAMNLAGQYASACHHDIHKRISGSLNLKALRVVENHHNFAWKEVLSDGSEGIVHRKGATPAGLGELGIIPGSMTAPGFIVKGRGHRPSLNSASHGAGRRMSRSAAKRSMRRDDMRKMLKSQGIELIGGGVDEAPQAYKDIREVMRHQHDLVDVLGSFTPRIVRMAKD